MSLLPSRTMAPALIAMHVIREFNSYNDAMAISEKGPWEEVFASNVPGSVDSVRAALELLKQLHAGRKELALKMTDQYMKVVKRVFSAEEYKEAEKQQEKYLTELLKREDWWGFKK